MNALHTSLIAALPAIDTVRWSANRKAAVVAAIDGGAIDADDACERYNLSASELESWSVGVRMNGAPGLRVTRLQAYKALCA